MALTNYVGSHGSGDWWYLPGTPFDRETVDGIFGLHSNVRISEITDGTSNTILAGERCWELPSSPGVNDKLKCYAAGVYGTMWSDVPPGYIPAATMGRGFHGINEQGIDPTHWQFQADKCGSGFSSYHPGGAQFLLSDGSARFVSENIERNTTGVAGDFLYQKLMAKADGFVIGEY